MMQHASLRCATVLFSDTAALRAFCILQVVLSDCVPMFLLRKARLTVTALPLHSRIYVLASNLRQIHPRLTCEQQMQDKIKVLRPSTLISPQQ